MELHVYNLKRGGSTVGKVTGKMIYFTKGINHLPKGEIDHLSPEIWEDRGPAPTQPDDDVPVLTLGKHVGGGFYQVLVNGEPVTEDDGPIPKKLGQGRANATVKLDNLQASLATQEKKEKVGDTLFDKGL